MENTVSKNRKPGPAFLIISYAFVLLAVVFTLFPIVYTLLGSFKTNAELTQGGGLFPETWHFEC